LSNLIDNYIINYTPKEVPVIEDAEEKKEILGPESFGGEDFPSDDPVYLKGFYSRKQLETFVKPKANDQ
jgi:hypothetical protein